MEISRSTILPIILNHSDIWKESDHRIWSFELTDPERTWNADDLTRVLGGLSALGTVAPSLDGLEVIAEEGVNAGFVLEINGQNHITKYCYAESPVVVPHSFSSRIIRVKEQLCSAFPINVSSMVRDHRVIASASEVGPAWNDVMKLFFLKKDFRFVDTSAHVAYVIRMSRNVERSFMTMKESDVTKRPMEYEMTMEVLPSIHTSTMSPEAKAGHIVSCIIRLMQILRHEAYVVTTQQKDSVIKGYKSLISPVVPKQSYFDKQKNKKILVPSTAGGGGGGKGESIGVGSESVEGGAKPKKDDTNHEADKDSVNKSDFFLLAPKPVTLEKVHLSDPGSGYGVITIQTGYAVTDKADGERMLMYVDAEGAAYLIDNSLDVRAMGIHTVNKTLVNSLFDGEFISVDKLTRSTDAETDLFAAFDVYFVNGQSIMRLPLITASPTKESRYGKLKAAFEADNWKRYPVGAPVSVEIKVKEHIAAEGSDMFAACRTMLNAAANKLPYEIDGLIFTPTKLPVFGTYENMPVTVPRGSKWERVFKWKPADQNTIDFLVKQTGTPCGLSPASRYQEFLLNTGYNPKAVEPIKTWMGLMMRYDYKNTKLQEGNNTAYLAKPFQPVPAFDKTRDIERAYFPIDAATGRVLAINGDVISDDDIVEVGFDPKKKGPFRWVPLRVRYDKVKKYKKLGTLSGNVNDYSTAMNIWRSIHNPVTMEMIIGETRLGIPSTASVEEATLGADLVYYDKQVEREHALSKNMLNFHTHGVKGMLYRRLKEGNKRTLLELACGKAGDLNRWWDAGLHFVLGVDLVKDNIQNPRDGAYSRLLSRRNIVLEKNANNVPIKFFNCVFAVGDIAKPINDGSAAQGIDPESVKVLKMVYGKRLKDAHGPHIDKVSRIISGCAADRFDAVSIQFAIHYMFEKESLLDGFLKNVADNLKAGGSFFGTCMDGIVVHDALSGTDKGVVEGRKKAIGSDESTQSYPIWAILRKYQPTETFDALTNADGKYVNAFGKRVDVYLEMTDNLIPEYLVHFDVLCAKCQKVGLVLSESGLFNTEYDKYLKNVPMHKTTADIELDAVQKQFSFYNRWFVFSKALKK